MDTDQLKKLYTKYGQQKVDEAIDYLSYKGAPKELPKAESGNYPILYVFRHGQTTDNADFIFSGWRDVELSEKGVKQAVELSKKLKAKKLDMLIASDLIRSVHTLEIAVSQNPQAQKLTLFRDPRIKERNYGDLQGKSKLELHLENAQKLKSMRRDYTGMPPNGESIEMVVNRVDEFLDELMPQMHKTKMNVAVCCHGNSIRGFRKRFEHLTDQETAEIESPLAQDYASYIIS